MINVLLAGVGGQGTVLAAKLLAQAAHNKGWRVRTAETIGMAQRGGCVMSHVRMGDLGEDIYSPLLAYGSADTVIAFEPAEGTRVLPYLAPSGTLVVAQTGIQPVTASLQGKPYDAKGIVDELMNCLTQERLTIVDDAALAEHIKSRKVLNTLLLARACAHGRLPFDTDDLRSAVFVCVRPQFVELNLKAIDIGESEA